MLVDDSTLPKIRWKALTDGTVQDETCYVDEAKAKALLGSKCDNLIGIVHIVQNLLPIRIDGLIVGPWLVTIATHGSWTVVHTGCLVFETPIP